MTRTATIRTLAAAGLALASLGATAGTSSAEPYGAGVFTGSGSGISTVEDDGDIVVSGPGLVSDRRLTEMLDATVTITVSPAGGVLPGIGECVDGASTFVFEGKRGVAMTLDGTGQICTRTVFGTFTETVFQGTFHVVDAQRQDLRGASGSYRVGIKPHGFTHGHASAPLI
jgi:hypothetical protein